MKYWDREIITNLTYAEAHRGIKNTSEVHYATRPEWNGVHFYDYDGDYCILLHTGELLINPKELMDKDKTDWMIVTITDEGEDLLLQNGLL
jgi:hypothetical protein